MVEQKTQGTLEKQQQQQKLPTYPNSFLALQAETTFLFSLKVERTITVLSNPPNLPANLCLLCFNDQPAVDEHESCL